MISAESRFRRDLSDFVDGRLANGRRARLESHLETCADCRREWQALASIKTTVHSTVTGREAPTDVVADVRAALDREDRAESARNLLLRSRGARRIVAFLAAAAAAVAILLLSPQPTDPPASAARDWERWTSGRLHLELRSESPHAISRFFAERGIAFPVPAGTLEVPGYRLVGARIHSLAGRRSAFYVYRNARNKILVCQMYEGSVADLPRGARVVARGGARLYAFRASGLTQVFWQDGRVVCALVSDIAPEELARIALPKASRA